MTYGRLATAAALACASCALAFPGHAAAEPTAEEKCSSEVLVWELYAFVVGSTLRPENGAEEVEHRPITFSGESEFQLSFQIASAESKLAHPDIDSGSGTASPGSSTTRYSFTSSKAAAKAGTIYWSASFTKDLASCNGGKGENRTFSTASFGAKPRSLTVLRESERAPEPPPLPPGELSPPTAGGLRVGIAAPRLVHSGHKAVAYLVVCTAACGGQTYIHVWELRGHRRPLRVRALDFGPRAVSIAGSSGGNQRFAQHYRGGVLKKLKNALRGGHELKLVVTAAVKDATGHSVLVQRVIMLKR